MGAVLSDVQVEQYHRDGFLRLEGFVDRARCADGCRAAESGVRRTGEAAVGSGVDAEGATTGGTESCTAGCA